LAKQRQSPTGSGGHGQNGIIAVCDDDSVFLLPLDLVTFQAGSGDSYSTVVAEDGRETAQLAGQIVDQPGRPIRSACASAISDDSNAVTGSPVS
jgi:hypothetical protein